MKTIVVTGGAGFIGSHLIDSLLKNNYFVVNIDNFDDFYPKKFKSQNISNAKRNKNYNHYQFDIRKTSSIKKIFEKYSPIYSFVHLAARAGVRPSIQKPLLYQKINIGGTYNLLNIAKNYEIRQLILASSSSVYGNSVTPFAEHNFNLFPLSPYGATKLACEQICFTYHKLYKIPTTILRFFSVYGPRGRPDMAPYLFTQSLFNNEPIKQFGDGSASRDWTYIDDIVSGIKRAIERPCQYEIINLGNSHPIKLNKLLKTIEKITKKKFHKIYLSKRKEEPDITFASIRKAKQLLDWEPKTEFTEGMKLFIKWFKANRLLSNKQNL